jgi:signal transduction histidine kinase
VRSAYVDYQSAERALIAVRRDNASVGDLIAQFEREVMPKRRNLGEAIDAFVVHKGERMEAGSSAARSAASRATRLAAFAIVLAIALCSTLAWIFGRQFARTSRREREALRVAERAVAARQELLGVVAHDLRSPLAAIGMKAAILRKTSTEDRARKSGESIENIGMRMEYVIRSLLDAASIETGKFSVSPAPCGVSEVLQETAETLGTLASTKSIRLELNLRDSDAWMLADRDRVLQVLTNLVENQV